MIEFNTVMEYLNIPDEDWIKIPLIMITLIFLFLKGTVTVKRHFSELFDSPRKEVKTDDLSRRGELYEEARKYNETVRFETMWGFRVPFEHCDPLIELKDRFKGVLNPKIIKRAYPYIKIENGKVSIRFTINHHIQYYFFQVVYYLMLVMIGSLFIFTIYAIVTDEGSPLTPKNIVLLIVLYAIFFGILSFGASNRGYKFAKKIKRLLREEVD